VKLTDSTGQDYYGDNLAQCPVCGSVMSKSWISEHMHELHASAP
jgi:hypothetical protein